MPDTTLEMETVKKELAEVSTFVKEHLEPVHDERVRLRKAIEALTTEQREARRVSVMDHAMGPTDARGEVRTIYRVRRVGSGDCAKRATSSGVAYRRRIGSRLGRSPESGDGQRDGREG